MTDESRFLTKRRLVVYPRIFLVAYAVLAAAWLLQSESGIDRRGRPLGADFVTFWAASRLALDGEPEAAYEPARVLEAERRAVPANERLFLWHYPPTFQLVVLPAALLPYPLSFLLWISLSLLVCGLVVRRIVPQPETPWLLLAFPGSLVVALHGQNSFLTAALLGGGLLALERRPGTAGVLLGLSSLKPQLALLVPLALVCGRRWKALVAAATSAAGFAAASAALLGLDTWTAFFENLPYTRRVLEEGAIPWSKMPTLFCALRQMGLPPDVAQAAHAAFAAAVASVVGFVWWRGTSLAVASATLASGALLVTPFLFDYDLFLLALPIAFLAREGVREGWLPWERAALVGAWLWPLVSTSLAAVAGLPVGWLGPLGLLGVAVRRARRAPARAR